MIPDRPESNPCILTHTSHCTLQQRHFSYHQFLSLPLSLVSLVPSISSSLDSPLSVLSFPSHLVFNFPSHSSSISVILIFSSAHPSHLSSLISLISHLSHLFDCLPLISTIISLSHLSLSSLCDLADVGDGSIAVCVQIDNLGPVDATHPQQQMARDTHSKRQIGIHNVP